jgi:hypothetical protein
MYELVNSKRPRSGPSWKISIAGVGLTERLRTMAFALLGLTAAAGLGLVALFAQPGWPLRPTGPLPSTPGQRGAISSTVAVARGGATPVFHLGPAPAGILAPAAATSGSVGFASGPLSPTVPSLQLGAAVRTVALPLHAGPEAVVPGPVGEDGEAPLANAPEAAAGSASEGAAAAGSGADGKPSGPTSPTSPVTSSATPEEIVAEAEFSPPPVEERAPEPAPEESLPEAAPEGEVEGPAEEAPSPSTEEVVAEEVAAVESAPEASAEVPAATAEPDQSDTEAN